MIPIADLPTRAEFIRDRLAEHLDGLGYFGFSSEPETLDQSPTLWFEWADGDRCVFVDELGAIRDLNEPGPRLTMRGFEWWPWPTDTGVMHGPALVAYDGTPTNCIHGGHLMSCAACIERLPAGHRVPGTTRTV
jgi:hypothetical protein